MPIIARYLKNCYSLNNQLFIIGGGKIGNQLKQIGKTVRTDIIPAISGGINCSDIEGKLPSFPSAWHASFLRDSTQRKQSFESNLKRFNNKRYK